MSAQGRNPRPCAWCGKAENLHRAVGGPMVVTRLPGGGWRTVICAGYKRTRRERPLRAARSVALGDVLIRLDTINERLDELGELARLRRLPGYSEASDRAEAAAGAD